MKEQSEIQPKSKEKLVDDVEKQRLEERILRTVDIMKTGQLIEFREFRENNYYEPAEPTASAIFTCKDSQANQREIIVPMAEISEAHKRITREGKFFLVEGEAYYQFRAAGEEMKIDADIVHQFGLKVYEYNIGPIRKILGPPDPYLRWA